ncbi:MAG: helix-turn-helix domain-containing protein [Cyclonatronaceae bacterium]
MQVTGQTNEFLELLELRETGTITLSDPLPDGFTVIWTLDDTTCLTVDGAIIHMKKDQIIFLTEFHRVGTISAGLARVIRFNRSFYCIIDHDADVGCKGILFFGASDLPLINLPGSEQNILDTVWKMFLIEMDSRDTYQLEMLQMMLKRLLIICTRLAREQQSENLPERGQTDLLREFNYLVEQHFRTRHTVAEYAEMLHKSPKTLSNIFSRKQGKSPLQIIHSRILLEARRLLIYTDKPVKEIGYELGFEDIHTFSRFFKNGEGVAPLDYRASR